MSIWTAKLQGARRAQFYTAYRAHMRAAPAVDMGFREMAWHCLALLQGDDREIAEANAILRGLDVRPCHFTPITFLQILSLHGPGVETDTRRSMLEYVRAALGPMASDRLHVTMYNDNFAALACYALVVGGELLNDGPALEEGRSKLRGFAEHFRRRGTVMEYGSPTYTPVNTHVFASLSAHAADPECRNLARQCEVRMWAEIASHLNISAKTVIAHQTNISEKLDIHSRTALVKFAISKGIIKLET